MSRADRTTRVLATALVACGLATFLVSGDRRTRNWEFLPNMVEAVPFESQSENPFFPDGMAMRAPPAGAIPRGLLPLFSGDVRLDLTETLWKDLAPEQQRAWDALAAPVPPAGEESKADARGEFVFQTFCTACHGAAGAGDGLATKRGVPPPPALTAEGAMGMSDGHLFRTITAGQGNMASYASQVGREDRWNVIRHIRKLQGR